MIEIIAILSLLVLLPVAGLTLLIGLAVFWDWLGE